MYRRLIFVEVYIARTLIELFYSNKYLVTVICICVYCKELMIYGIQTNLNLTLTHIILYSGRIVIGIARSAISTAICTERCIPYLGWVALGQPNPE